jgi:hypothetical protein
MAEDNAILAALGLKAPATDRHWSFQVSDIVLTAAMLAGGTDPIHKLMDAFRKFMETSSAKASETSN